MSFHRALLHWIDSLTGVGGPGMTAGKTWNAHRDEYRRRLGPPGADDVRWLERYLDARGALAEAGGGNDGPGLTGAFYEAPDLGAAIERAGSLLPRGSRADFAGAVRHFAPKYETVWNGGAEAVRFLERARDDRRRLRRLSRFLAGVAKFYAAEPGGRPTLVLVPVPHGHGTHAQAVGRFLLVEIRPGEGLRDQVAPIVHENAHFLFLRSPAPRREALAAAAASSGEHGPRAWALLQEALPTAIAQGVADSRLGNPGWSTGQPWYHEARIDAYAKRIYPIVRRALARGAELDENLLAELLRASEPLSGS